MPFGVKGTIGTQRTFLDQKVSLMDRVNEATVRRHKPMVMKKITPTRTRNALIKLREEIDQERDNPYRRQTVEAITNLLDHPKSVAKLAKILDEVWKGEDKKKP